MNFHVTSKWVDNRSSISHCKKKNVKKYGTVFNTVSAGTKLDGILRRR